MTSTGTDGYGLRLPTLEDVHASVARVHSTATWDVWGRLLATAGLTGREEGREPVERVLAAMTSSGDELSILCALAVQIRLNSFDRLNAAHRAAHLTRSTR